MLALMTRLVGGKRRSLLFPDFAHLPSPMLAAALMSASSSIDTYDTQMLDFPSDTDVPMNIQGATEFFTESLMDHDGHTLTSAYAEHASVEVDMEEYVGDNAEYEMADETADYQRPHGDELLDVEVYDASHAPSPLAPPQPLQPSSDVHIESEHILPAFSDSARLHLSGEPESEGHHVSLDHPAADIPHEEPTAPGVVISSDAEKEAVVTELIHPLEPSGESMPPTSESHEQPEDAAFVSGQPSETPAPADADAESESHVHTFAEEHPSISEVPQHEHSELPTAESAPLAGVEDLYDSGPPVVEEKVAAQEAVTEGEGVYIEPPPAVLLSIADSSEPELSLFSQPEADPESTEVSHGKQKAYSLLLESRPTLYYEPLSNVFEALRQDDDLLSRIPHSFEGELVLDAYDLQLVVSEDNIHSRDISLHDLNILHDGSDFAGPLRLHLRAIIPRFIIRYYALQEQVQSLNLAAETGEGEHYEEQHEHYDTTEELQHHQEEEVGHPSAETATEPLEVPSSTAAEERVEEAVLPVPTEEPQEDEDSTAVQEPAAEYHEVTGEATHALEDEDDYEGTNAGDEDESIKSEILDADQVHDVAAEDTDAPATVTGQESEFGGEQTEYLDYVQPEEYDERYGEDLPEQAGGASPVQYGEPPHYEEEGEQDTSTAVDETQVILPGSDEEEPEESATPMPAPVVLEPETSEPVHEDASSQPVAATQEKVATSQDHSTRESAAEATHNTEDIQQTSKTDVDVFREVDESDSNFVALLEREADAEFDRAFDADKSGQEGSVEDALKNDETWDEWDDEDAEGEDEEDWVDPDVASNESSVTLSSKASSKRGFDEVEPGEEPYAEDSQSSPGSKRPRVQ